MSKKLGKIEGPHEIVFTQFLGEQGKGLCIQLTGYNCDNKIGCISLTEKEAELAIIKLGDWLLK
ncbi:MAG: hypothetical protein ACTSPI_00500 [Candidatus Heimdallarchaeaceae archaeon]